MRVADGAPPANLAVPGKRGAIKAQSDFGRSGTRPPMTPCARNGAHFDKRIESTARRNACVRIDLAPVTPHRNNLKHTFTRVAE
ncbi:hypothetical protein [Paraburkholderia sp. BL21I4N1]|uniref:hypothetical protein n=1 Tax=Paraburkholderia sp. BL21I4N1 TaxID=1938801 RepID=UPI000CFB5D9D|nr:hypothetical protein [Paraburkholderia sp. BL21I4N1]PQV53870.1 hypothetical protein B0G83_10152 [Paraburkholderia sp. BL21I4N1]